MVNAYAQDSDTFPDYDQARHELSLAILALLPVEEELIWRKETVIQDVKLTYPVLSDGYRTIHGYRWPGRRIKVIDFNSYVCFTANLTEAPGFCLFAVRLSTPKANRIERYLRRPWAGVL